MGAMCGSIGRRSAGWPALERLREDLAAKGRAIMSVTIELHDESGTHTLSATVEWFITRIPDASEEIGGTR